MKLRNRLLAFFCLALFVAGGVAYFRHSISDRPFGMILFVGDGLTTGNVTAARLYEGGADHRLELERLPRMALLANHAEDYAVPDAASAGTALATGHRVNNGNVGSTPDGKWLRSILELADEAGRSTGIITTGCVTDAGVAAFYAHEPEGRNTAELARQLAENRTLDLVLAGGARDFLPEPKGGARKDGRDLILEMRSRGTEVIRSRDEWQATARFRTSPLVGLFAHGEMTPEMVPGRPEPPLSELVSRAIETLQFNPRGYLLVVDAGLIGRAAAENQGERLLTEILALDHAVATAREYAGEKTLLVVAGRQAIGGPVLNGYPMREDRGVALLGTNPFGYPAITWATGPSGPVPVPSTAPGASPQPAPTPPAEPAAFFLPAAISTAEDVLAVGSGPGSEDLHGFLENTAIFDLLKKSL